MMHFYPSFRSVSVTGKSMPTGKELRAAVKVQKEGVAAIHNSIDLWNHYLDFKLATTTDNQELERLFERAAVNVGYDFLAHPFWDKYIDFVENRVSDPKKLMELMNRIVIIPMHQYARYYEKWRGLCANTKPSEAVNDATLQQFLSKIKAEKGELTGDALEKALREKLDAQIAKVYKETQEGTNKRWVYEAEIKRSYFHIKPLDRPQLQNWNKYLDFEESAGDVARIRALYERCLVPCAQYEDFWLRYGQWLAKNNLISEAKSAYERAAYTFLPKDKIHIKLALALVLEEEGNIDEARSTYTSILQSTPTHIEAITDYIHFERRQNTDTFESLISQYISSAYLDESARIYLTIQYIKYLQQKMESDKIREMYETYSSAYVKSKYFWINYINFELGLFDKEANKRIIKVFEKARKSLSAEDQQIINNRYRSYLMERGDDIHLLNRVPLHISTEFKSENEESNTLKRPHGDDNNNNNPCAKQPRYDAYAGYGQQSMNYAGSYYTPQ
ncbi:hypothetical protein RMCBS344292_14175 [Rhizopus microsporus]|nr:hypothetical protein RMCBS344292_14175 [Rhizopus microsporus]